MFEEYYPNKWGLTPHMNLNQLPMFISVIKGLKPAMTGACSEKVYPELKELCKKFKMYIEHSNYKTVYPSKELLNKISERQKLPTTRHICVPLEDPRSGSVMFYIAQTKEKAREARRFHWENQIINGRIVSTSFVDHRKFGLAVGYPEHCVDLYINSIQRRINPTERAYKGTKEEFSFLTNNLPMDHTYFLTHFHPTSFDDLVVKKLAKERLKAIKEEDEVLAKKIEHHLKLPYLVFEEKCAIAFEGKLNKNSLKYTDCHLVGNPEDNELFEQFVWENGVRVFKDRIELYRDNNLIKTIEKKHEFNGFFLKCD